MLRPLRATRAPVGSVHTSLHGEERHTSSLLRLFSIQPLLVRERHLRHPKAFDINQIAITAPDPAEPACICSNMQLRCAVSLICRQRASWLSRRPILDSMTDSCPKHAQPSRFPVSLSRASGSPTAQTTMTRAVTCLDAPYASTGDLK